MKRKAIIMGATSGIGREVAKLLLNKGWEIGITGRRKEELIKFQQKAPNLIHFKTIDVCKDDAPILLLELIDEMGGIDLYVHSSGYGKQNINLDTAIEKQTLLTNGVGFTTMIDAVYNYFANTGEEGHITAITSIAGTKGLGAAPAYSATKRLQWTYLEALAQQARMRKLAITFTDFRPGFVATDFLGNDHYPMLMQKKYVAKKIVQGIFQHRRRVTIDWHYRLLCFFWKLTPSFIWERMKIRT